MGSGWTKADDAIEARYEANRLDEHLKWMETLGYGPDEPEYIKVAERYKAKLAEAWGLWREYLAEGEE